NYVEDYVLSRSQTPQSAQSEEVSVVSVATPIEMDDINNPRVNAFKKTTVNHKNVASFLDQITWLTPTEDDKFSAYQAIMKRWGVDYPREPFVLACDFAEMYGLRCLHNSGNWRSLLKLDRPTVMTLNNELGQTLYFALL